MFVARLTMEARFGHKQFAIDLLTKWDETIGRDCGVDASKQRNMTGSIGAKEALLVTEWEVSSLAELEQIFAKVGAHPDHAAWGLELEPHIVSGTSRWEIFRVI